MGPAKCKGEAEVGGVDLPVVPDLPPSAWRNGVIFISKFKLYRNIYIQFNSDIYTPN